MKRLLLAVVFASCSSAPVVDAGFDAGPADAGAPDAGVLTDDGGADAGEVDAGEGWVDLWNGVDFTGFVRWVGSPGNGQPVYGLENDPRQVFTVVQREGAPAIRVSGEVWGALTTERTDYGNFELEAEYQWGTAIYPPLNFRDSGLMYLSSRDFGAVNAGGDALSSPIGSGSFMVSMEYQISPGTVGDVANLGPITHTPSARSQVAEVTSGWNQVRLVVRPDGAEHWLNGQLVRSTTGFTLRWPNEAQAPLTQGRIQVQSEGAEIYFRRLRLRPL